MWWVATRLLRFNGNKPSLLTMVDHDDWEKTKSIMEKDNAQKNNYEECDTNYLCKAELSSISNNNLLLLKNIWHKFS